MEESTEVKQAFLNSGEIETHIIVGEVDFAEHWTFKKLLKCSYWCEATVDAFIEAAVEQKLMPNYDFAIWL